MSQALSSRKDNSKKGAIHQLLIGFTYGDAISNQARWIQGILREQGYSSEMYAHYFESDSGCRHCEELPLDDESSLIYHHSMGFEYIDILFKFRGKKTLIYHNITPYGFFVPYDTMIAHLLKLGREQLSDMADLFEESYGVSLYNAAELKELGFRDVRLLPLIVSRELWDFAPSQDIIRRYSGTKNILFTGRLSPNKAQTDLIEMLRYLRTMKSDAMLILVGGGDMQQPYVQEIYQLIREYRLEGRVVVTGQVDDAALKAYYMVADIFVSMSEHEGFGVPLIEAMWFDVPVVAYKSGAVAETLGDSALMFCHKRDLPSVAALVSIVLDDAALREKIIEAQRVTRQRFTPQNIKSHYMEMIEKLTPQTRKHREAERRFKQIKAEVESRRAQYEQ